MRSWTSAVVLAAAMGVGMATAPALAATHEVSTGARTLEVVDLGTLPGAVSSEALGINDRGWVVGWSDVGDAVSRAFLWRDGRMTDLGSLGGAGGSSVAHGINRRGDIVGSSSAPEGSRAVLWRDGRMVDLGTLGGSIGVATGINDRDEIVGYSTTSTEEYHAFLWRGGRMTDLGTVAGQTFSQANAVNTHGLVVGESGGPVVWRHGTPHPLPSLPGAEFGSALGTNDHGDVVGYLGYPSGRTVNRAVIWRNGRPVDLGFEDGVSQAFDVNDRGQIIGWRELVPMESWAPFLWDRGAVTNLPSLTGTGGVATAINNRGEIVGRSPVPDDAFGHGHAVLWR